MRVLLLGGTTEATALAQALADRGVDSILSYAGRTRNPAAQPVPVRIGGFGGIKGLVTYLRDNNITHLIDATHPFAAQMSVHAHAASTALDVPLTRLERAPWQPEPGDTWRCVADMGAAIDALPDRPATVFLAIGKQHIGAFAAKPQHRYILRLVDRPDRPLPLPDTEVIIARGPFSEAGDTALMRDHQVTHIVAKNAGGTGAEAKLRAARALGLPVILIDRPTLPPTHISHSIGDALAWLSHEALRGV